MEDLLQRMCGAETNSEILSIAHRIIAKRREVSWIKQRIEKLYVDSERSAKAVRESRNPEKKQD